MGGGGAHLTYIKFHIARFGVLTAIFGHQVKSEYTCIFHHACVPHPPKWFPPWFSTIFWFVNRFLALYRYIPYRYFRPRWECPKSRHATTYVEKNDDDGFFKGKSIIPLKSLNPTLVILSYEMCSGVGRTKTPTGLETPWNSCTSFLGVCATLLGVQEHT